MTLWTSIETTVEWLQTKVVPAGTIFHFEDAPVEQDKPFRWRFDLDEYFEILGFRYSVTSDPDVVEIEEGGKPDEELHCYVMGANLFRFKHDLPTNQFFQVSLDEENEKEENLKALSSITASRLGRVRWDPMLSDEFVDSIPFYSEEELAEIKEERNDPKNYVIFREEDEVFE